MGPRARGAGARSQAQQAAAGSGNPASTSLAATAMHDAESPLVKFLIRSLSRCDLELSVLNRLNRELQSLRKILADPDEELLLEIGEGRIRLSPDQMDVVMVGDENDETGDKTQNTAASTSTTATTPAAKTTTAAAPEATTSNTMADMESVFESDRSAEKEEESGPTASSEADKNSEAAPQVSSAVPTQDPGPILRTRSGGVITAHQRQLCLDFLLRMKLRRRLLNRLVRRLQRLSAAMDGENVQPPLPPKYGDLRLSLPSTETLEKFQQREETVSEAMERLRYKGIIGKPILRPSMQQETHPGAEIQSMDLDTPDEKDVDVPSGSKEINNDGDGVMSEGDPVKGKTRADGYNEKTQVEKTEEDISKKEDPDGHESDLEDQSDDDGDEPKKDGDKKDDDDDASPDRATSSATQVSAPLPVTSSHDGTQEPLQEPDTTVSTENAGGDDENGQPPVESNFPLDSEEIRKDVSQIMEYDVGYDKLVSSSSTRYALLEEMQNKGPAESSDSGSAREEDYTAIKYGAGVGATHRTMSTREKEAEWFRWQNDILAAIPDQPTFADLGMDNRVFLLEKRRKRLRDSKIKKLEEKEEVMTAGEKENKEEGEEEDEEEEELQDPTKGGANEDEEFSVGDAPEDKEDEDKPSSKKMKIESIEKDDLTVYEDEEETKEAEQENGKRDEQEGGTQDERLAKQEEEKKMAEEKGKKVDGEGDDMEVDEDDEAEEKRTKEESPVEEDSEKEEGELDDDEEEGEIVAEKVEEGEVEEADVEAKATVVDDEDEDDDRDMWGTDDDDEVEDVAKGKEDSDDEKEEGEVDEDEDIPAVPMRGKVLAKKKSSVDDADDDGEGTARKKSTEDNNEEDEDDLEEGEVVDDEEDEDNDDGKADSQDIDEERRQNLLKGKTFKNKVADDDKDETAEVEGQHDANDKEGEPEKKEENEEGNKTEPPPPPPKKVRPFSLQPVPSFFEQDLRRIRNIHADLLAVSMHEDARLRIADSIKEYNRAFHTSMECNNRNLQLQAELNKLLYQHKMEGAKIKEKHEAQASTAYSSWAKRKEDYEAKRRALLEHERRKRQFQRNVPPPRNLSLAEPDTRGVVKRVLQSMVDSVVVKMSTLPTQIAVGTPMSNAAARSTGLTAVIGNTLGHMADAVVLRAESGWIDDKDKSISEGFDDFHAPTLSDTMKSIVDPNTGENMAQRHERLEARLKKESMAASNRLQEAEDERRKAWKKMLKIKADFETVTVRGVAGAGGRKTPPDAASQLQSMPMPPLRGPPGYVAQPLSEHLPLIPSVTLTPTPTSTSSVVVVPAVAAATPAPAPKVPQLPVPPTTPASTSKYSAEAIKARIDTDGSVRPVTMPKKNKDGLFMRPAGRRRKGMEWDPVYGKWTPATEQTNNEDAWE